jgi:lipoprotein NlpI
MKFLYGCALLFAAMATTALAGGYSDFNAGVAARNRGDSDLALRLFSSALEAPDLPTTFRATAYFDRGTIYLWRRKTELAIADLTACLAITPNYAPAMEARGTAYMRQKQYDLARRDFEAEAAARPDLLDGPRNLVSLDILTKDFDAALKISNTAVDKWPNADTSYIMRADTYRAMGKQDAAMEDYDTAVSKSSHTARAYLSRAKTRKESGDLRKALDDYESAIDYLPAESDVHQMIGFLQWDLGRFYDAEKTFQAALPLHSAWAYDYLWLYLAQAKDNAGAPSRLADGYAKLDANKWPAPLVGLYSGKTTPGEVMKAAALGDDATKADKLCEANFYAAEWQLLHGARPDATRMLSDAAHNCRDEMIEKTAAAAELGRLR